MNNKDELLLQFGKNVKEIRQLRGYTQEQFSDMLNVSLNYVSLLERGKCGISLSTIVKVCKVLSTEPNMLFKNIITLYDNIEDSLILNSIREFNDDDKNAVMNLINYIIKSKF